MYVYHFFLLLFLISFKGSLEFDSGWPSILQLVSQSCLPLLFLFITTFPNSLRNDMSFNWLGSLQAHRSRSQHTIFTHQASCFIKFCQCRTHMQVHCVDIACPLLHPSELQNDRIVFQSHQALRYDSDGDSSYGFDGFDKFFLKVMQKSCAPKSYV